MQPVAIVLDILLHVLLFLCLPFLCCRRVLPLVLFSAIPLSSQQYLPAKYFHIYISNQISFLRNISLSSITHFFTCKYHMAPKCNIFKTECITSLSSLLLAQAVPTQVMMLCLSQSQAKYRYSF